MILLGIMLSCQRVEAPVEEMEIEIDQLYAIVIPNNLKAGYDMHDYASLQYYSTAWNYYVLGLEDNKDDLAEINRLRLKVKGYYNFVENTVFEKVDAAEQIESKQISTQSEVKGMYGDYYVSTDYFGDTFELFYRIAVYEGKTHFFQIVMWMPYQEHCDRMEWVDRTTYSFRLLEKEME